MAELILGLVNPERVKAALSDWHVLGRATRKEYVPGSLNLYLISSLSAADLVIFLLSAPDNRLFIPAMMVHPTCVVGSKTAREGVDPEVNVGCTRVAAARQLREIIFQRAVLDQRAKQPLSFTTNR